MASGRKKAFDEKEALRAAMEVFWLKGYVGASLTDLTLSMGINKPSLYSAFGNKEALFIKATKLYIESAVKVHLKVLNEPNTPLAQRLKNYMMSIIATQCESEQPKGCFLVLCQSETLGGDIPEAAARFLQEAGNIPKQRLTAIFKEDPEAITLKLNQNADGNVLSLYTTLTGTASMARSGVAITDLEYVVDTTLRGIGIE
ncbi:TetR family transcriptional regulator [Colwellia sp. 39_35_sub15_T18]|nr:TetR family transcriptional regulator [Colwellia sp. 39_35_sub15_T18]